jgi:hypothetical protein
LIKNTFDNLRDPTNTTLNKFSKEVIKCPSSSRPKTLNDLIVVITTINDGPCLISTSKTEGIVDKVKLHSMFIDARKEEVTA